MKILENPTIRATLSSQVLIKKVRNVVLPSVQDHAQEVYLCMDHLLLRIEH